MPDRGAIVGPTPYDAFAFGEGAITLWANLLTLMATHLREQGMSRAELLEMLTMLHGTHEATIGSLWAKASAASHVMAVYAALETS